MKKKKKEIENPPIIDPITENINIHYAAASTLDDFVFPYRGSQGSNITISTLPADNLDDTKIQNNEKNVINNRQTAISVSGSYNVVSANTITKNEISLSESQKTTIVEIYIVALKDIFCKENKDLQFQHNYKFIVPIEFSNNNLSFIAEYIEKWAKKFDLVVKILSMKEGFPIMTTIN